MAEYKKILGIDPSINSTGVCLHDIDRNANKYYIITSKITNKYRKFLEDNLKFPINYYIYSKDKPDKSMSYSEKENIKTSNTLAIAGYINNIIKKTKPDLIRMEGISYGSTGGSALVDLAGLNFVLRQVFVQNGVEFEIVSPVSLKQKSTGVASADKDLMVHAWEICDADITKKIQKFEKAYNGKIKIDDVADAYFLAVFHF